MSNNQIEPGDLAIIIKSVTGESIGRIVECVRVNNVHEKFGVVWWVKAPSAIKVVGIDEQTNMGLCPQDWLRKIPKDPLPDEDEDVRLPTHDLVDAGL